MCPQGSGKTYTMTGAHARRVRHQRCLSWHSAVLCSLPAFRPRPRRAGTGGDRRQGAHAARDSPGRASQPPACSALCVAAGSLRVDLARNACKQVFAELGCRQLARWAVDVTYVQIYNEAFQDLLCPGTPAADISVVDQKRAPSCMHGPWQQQQGNKSWHAAADAVWARHLLSAGSACAEAPVTALRRGRLAVKGLLRMGCACAQDALNALMQVCDAWPWAAWNRCAAWSAALCSQQPPLA